MRLRRLASALRPLALVSFVLLLLAALAAWCFPHQALTLDSGRVKADVLVVLGGGTLDRVERALELFKAGEAPRILVSGKGDSEPHKRWLVAAGVPESAIEIEGQSTSTKENAEFTVAMLRTLSSKRQSPGETLSAYSVAQSVPAASFGSVSLPARAPGGTPGELAGVNAFATAQVGSSHQNAERPLRVIIVSSWYHSRRALNCFRHYGPEIEFYSRPSYVGYSRADWKPKGIARYVRSEYLKLLGYWGSTVCARFSG